MKKGFGGKNNQPTCSTKFCAANTGGTNPEPKTEVKTKDPQPKTEKKVKPIEQAPMSLNLNSAIDHSQVDRNRQLRRQMDQARLREQQDALRISDQVATGSPEITKIRLIALLQKFQSLTPPLEYKLLYDYFQTSFKSLDRQNLDVTIINDALVDQFSREELKDSQTCYVRALDSINKTRTTNFLAASEIVAGLAQILADLK